MRLRTSLPTVLAISLVVSLAGFMSCGDPESPIAREADYAVEEAIMDAYFEDVDDMVGMAIVADEGTVTGGKTVSNGRRVIHVEDGRFGCAEVTIEFADNSNIIIPHGVITINFGETCEDDKGNVRRGKIVVSFEGRRFIPGSSVVETLENYAINDIKIHGTRTVTNVSTSSDDHPVFRILLEDGIVNWPDGTSARRDHDFRREWKRNVLTDYLDDRLEITGKASGVNRSGREYEMDIIEPIVYRRGCPIAVAGVKEFRTKSSTITIDYGDGSCDRSIAISVSGQQQNVTVTN